MLEMKYVVVESALGIQMVMFPKNIAHKQMAEVLSYIKEDSGRGWKRVHREPISAGFTDGVRCYGESESLSIKSRPDADTQLLTAGGFQAP